MFLATAKFLECGGQGGNRTPDASLFRAALYQLSYLAKEGLVYQIRLCFRFLLLGIATGHCAKPNDSVHGPHFSTP
jgi:hypothetical protein